jgi:hypothetical protein
MAAIIIFLLFIGFVILAIVLAIGAKKRADDRRAALTAFASANGLQYMPGTLSDTLPGGFLANLFGDHSQTEEARFLAHFARFYPFDTGDSPAVNNLVFGHVGDLDWIIFDYSYETSTTDNEGNSSTTTHAFNVVMGRVPASLPLLILKPENFLHRIGAKLGMQDLQLEHEQFNRRYVVQCPDPKAAYELLHPQAIELLMAHPARMWQMAGFQILLVESGYSQVDMIRQMMAQIEGFSRLLPGHVTQSAAPARSPAVRSAFDAQSSSQ